LGRRPLVQIWVQIVAVSTITSSSTHSWDRFIGLEQSGWGSEEYCVPLPRTGRPLVPDPSSIDGVTKRPVSCIRLHELDAQSGSGSEVWDFRLVGF
jgi:hypothetical protein